MFCNNFPPRHRRFTAKSALPAKEGTQTATGSGEGGGGEFRGHETVAFGEFRTFLGAGRGAAFFELPLSLPAGVSLHCVH